MAETEVDVPLEHSIRELRRRLRDGRLTSEGLVTRCLERIRSLDRSGPCLRAMIHVADDALEVGRERDRERAGGHERGRLHGIPIVLKDNIETAAMPTTAGSAQFAGYRPARTAPLAQRLLDAGAIVIGKTNLHEFSYGLTTLSSLGGQTLNPYDLTRNPGGSSGGTAVAVTSGFAVAGIGTDTGGSVRFPAAHTNLFGLRPTAGLLPGSGVVPLSRTMDVVGPITRHATDLDDMMCALTGRERYTAELDGVELRIGVLEDYFGSLPGETGASEVVRDALGRVAASGVHLESLRGLELQERAGDTALYEFEDTLGDYLAVADPAPPATSVAEVMAFAGLTPGVRDHMALALEFSGNTVGLREAVRQRARVRTALEQLFEERRLHALVYPTFRSTARPLAEEYWEGSNAMLSSVSGMPAVTVPAGFSEGLPVGLELLAPALNEPLLVALATRIERLIPCRRRPLDPLVQ